MRMGPGPVSPANLMHPSQDQHMSPLTSDVMATIAARVNQVAHVYQSAAKQQRGGNNGGVGPGVVDHLMDKELQFMQQGLSGVGGGVSLQQGLQSMAGGGGTSTLPLNLIGGKWNVFFKFLVLFNKFNCDANS